MTIEQKALELANEALTEIGGRTLTLDEVKRLYPASLAALTRALEAHEADKARYEARTSVLLERDARHAAEMREQAERFSEVAGLATTHLRKTEFTRGSPMQKEREAVIDALSPYLTAPVDPLVEAVTDALQEADCDTAADWTLEGGKAFISALTKRGYGVGPIVKKEAV